MTLWRFTWSLWNDRRGTVRDHGRISESQGAAPKALARPGAHDSAVREPQAGSLETGLPASHSVQEGASRTAEATYPDGPLASRRACR